MIATYDTFMQVLEKGELGSKRLELVTSAYGRVLEIGTGTGVNIQFYINDQIEEIVFSDKELSPFLDNKLSGSLLNYKIQAMEVESLPFSDNYFDTIVVTLVFCSVKNVQEGLTELRRVLKEGGQVIFIEHVLPDHEPLIKLFNMATPVWKHIASGCHLNRNFIESLKQASFKTEEVSKFNKSAFVSGKAYKKVKV